MKKAVLLSALLTSLLAAAGVPEDPVTVTTDTREYCLSLADRITARGTMTPYAEMLWQRGRTMCEQDRVRDGLNRLRRALLLLRGVPHD